MKKPTPEDRERTRRNHEFSELARANMQRLIDEHEQRRRELEARAQRSLWRRLRGLRRAA